VGVQQLAKADLSSDRNLFISGFSLFMGLSVPAYFLAIGNVVDINTVGQTWAIYRPTAEGLLAVLSDGARGVVVAVGSTGMAIAALIGIILDNLIPGTPEERGLKLPSLLAPEGADATEGGPPGRH
jgi:xanthine/uracil permease